MFSMFQKHALMVTIFLSSLVITACGNKKDVVVAGGPVKNLSGTPNTNSPISNVPPSNAPPANTIPPSGNSQNPPAKDTGSAPSQGNAQEKPPTGQLPLPLPYPKPDMADLPNPSLPTPPPPVEKVRPAPTTGPISLPIEYKANDPQNVEREGLTKRVTGAVTADGLVYTSSAPDQLLDFLRAKNERQDQATRSANLAAAASVQSAKLAVDSFSGDAILTIKIRENGDVKVYNLSGALVGGIFEHSATRLKAVAAGNGEITTGIQLTEGTIKCLDLDGGCENILARILIGTPGTRAVMNIVFRNSVSDLYFSLPGVHSENSEYLILREFIINTIKQENSENKIKQARMSTFEVVNGHSGIVMTMKGQNNELLGFAGPLLAPEAGNGVNVVLSRIANEQESNLDLITSNQVNLNYANWIGDARLIANNGLGQVKLALVMRKRANFTQDIFTVTFMRKVKPLFDLSDESLK